MVKNPPANAGDRRHGLDPWVGKIPWRRKWLPTLVFLPGKSSGQRSLVGYSPCGHKRVRYDLATKQQIKYMLKAIGNYTVCKLYLNKNINGLEMNFFTWKIIKYCQ